MKEITKWKIATGVFAVLFIIALFNGGLQGSSQKEDAAAQQETGAADMTLFSDDVVKGKSNALITIIEYSDPSCPFCAAAAGFNEQVINYLKSRDSTWTAPVPGIIKDYVDKGKVKLVFRYYPGHGTGADAMKIMLCANEQNKFWEVHDKVFANQDKVADKNAVLALAEGIGADKAKLESCLASGKYDKKLSDDTNRGKSSGISGTPGFIVNGVLVSGAQPYSAFKQALDAMLK